MDKETETFIKKLRLLKEQWWTAKNVLVVMLTVTMVLLSVQCWRLNEKNDHLTEQLVDVLQAKTDLERNDAVHMSHIAEIKCRRIEKYKYK